MRLTLNVGLLFNVALRSVLGGFVSFGQRKDQPRTSWRATAPRAAGTVDPCRLIQFVHVSLPEYFCVTAVQIDAL